MKASDLRPSPRNWRTHNTAQKDVLRGVLAEIGMADALLARELPDGSLELIDGHCRADVDSNMTWPVLILDVTEEEANKLLVTIDPLAAMAGADAAKLDGLLKEMDIGNDAVKNMLDELAQDVGCDFGTPAEVIDDEVPEPPAVPVTQPGDLYVLGEHRLLCGDSARISDVHLAMDGKRATCIFTDPPYGVSVGAKNRLLNSFQKAGRNLTDIKSDDLSPGDLYQMLLPAFVNVRNIAMAEDCTLFTCSPQGGGLGMMMMMMMQDAGLQSRHVLIWYKNSPTFSLGRLDYDYQHEPILLTWLKRHKRPMEGKHKTSVWKVDKPRKSADHPTMKPVELYANAYLNNSDKGDVVFDPYAGSGTMFIAAEQVGRIAVGIEIEPRYCDVIVRRWESLTGKKAERRCHQAEVPPQFGDGEQRT